MSKPVSEDLTELLKTPICFCTLCSHQPAYGYCWSCRCHNHLPEPLDMASEIDKLKSALAHWQEIAIEMKRQRDIVLDKSSARAECMRQTQLRVGR